MRAREIISRIERLGGRFVRQVGSHRRYVAELLDEEGNVIRKAYTTVAQHAGDVPVGTMRAIQKDLAEIFGEGWLSR